MSNAKTIKIIDKEFDRDEIETTLTVTIEVDNKQHVIILDNNSNYTQKKYDFAISEYCNDDVDQDILELFEESDHYAKMCDYAENEAIALDDENEELIEKEIEENYEIFKQDNHFYNNRKLTIFKKKDDDDDFILRVEEIENNYCEQYFFDIYQSDFDQDSDEVVLEESYKYDHRNKIESI
jgi:transcription elongation factor Elf1